MHRLLNFDSDHFRIIISFQFESHAHLEQRGFAPDTENVEMARKKWSIHRDLV